MEHLPSTEFLVLYGLSVGRSRAQISRDLGLSIHGLPHHERKLYGRLAARTQAHAVAQAYERGILQPSRTGPSKSVIRARDLLAIRRAEVMSA